jgi:hypothetical protein
VLPVIIAVLITFILICIGLYFLNDGNNTPEWGKSGKNNEADAGIPAFPTVVPAEETTNNESKRAGTTNSGRYTVRTKTYFHTEADASTVRRAYLVEGDQVYVEKTENGFGYVSFTNTQGPVTSGWLKMADLSEKDGDEGSSLQQGGSAKKPNDLVRSDNIIIEEFSGDLNRDGIADWVAITKQTKEELMTVKNQFDAEVDRNRRGIFIAFKDKEAYYHTVLAIPDCFSSEHEDGGVYFPPEMSVGIKSDSLIIHYWYGRYGRWEYVFRYRNGNFELTGYDQSTHRGPVMESKVSINFLTKKQQTLTNINTDAETEEDEVFEETLQDIVMDKLLKLTDINDFDEFMVYEYFTER